MGMARDFALKHLSNYDNIVAGCIDSTNSFDPAHIGYFYYDDVTTNNAIKTIVSSTDSFECYGMTILTPTWIAYIYKQTSTPEFRLF